MREKQPYIINPVTENPYELFTIPKRKVVAETTKSGKFKRVISLSKKRHHKAKQISKKRFLKLASKVLKTKKLAKTHKTKSLSKKIKKHRKQLQKTFDIYKDLLHTSKQKLSKKDIAYKKHFKLNPLGELLVINPTRKGYMKRKYRRNPIITKKQIGDVSTLLVDGAIVVAGVMAGKFAMDNLSKVKFLQKPVMRIGGQITLGSIIYLLGSQFKKIPMRYVNLLSLGIIAPAISDAVGMITKKSPTPVSEIDYEGEDYTGQEGEDYTGQEGEDYTGQETDDVDAYVPETDAYVPETDAYVPETEVSGLGEGEYTA